MVYWRDDGNDPIDNRAMLVRTLITWDNGKTWQSLQPPSVDSQGVPINCTGDCTLNLFGLTTWLGVGGDSFYGEFYSAPGAIGLILATGNVRIFTECSCGIGRRVLKFYQRNGEYVHVERWRTDVV